MACSLVGKLHKTHVTLTYVRDELHNVSSPMRFFILDRKCCRTSATVPVNKGSVRSGGGQTECSSCKRMKSVQGDDGQRCVCGCVLGSYTDLGSYQRI